MDNDFLHHVHNHCIIEITYNDHMISTLVVETPREWRDLRFLVGRARERVNIARVFTHAIPA